MVNTFIRNKLLKMIAISFLASICALCSAAAPAADVAVVGRQIFIDGKPFTMKGVGYSPVPIGIDPETSPPYGDYFPSEYGPIHSRDIPILRRMGYHAHPGQRCRTRHSASQTHLLHAHVPVEDTRNVLVSIAFT
jgi:hypothetical protein